MPRGADSAAATFRPAHPLPPACNGCPARSAARGFVPPDGPREGPLLFLGQGPGLDEGALGRPLVGRTGQRLTRWCVTAGVLKAFRGARLGNIVQCVLPGERPPTQAEADFCRAAHWGPELENRQVIIALGVPALAALLGRRASVADTGQWFELPSGALLLGLVNPADILRGAWGLDPIQTMHLQRVRAVLEGGFRPFLADWSQPPPKTLLWPTLAELKAWAARLGPNGITVDVEAAANVLRHVGLRSNDSLEGVQVAFRTLDGDLWLHCRDCGGPDPTNLRSAGCPHEWDEFRPVVRWLAELLADASVPKTFQNGQAYDVPEQLERVGFLVRGYCWDTLLMSHLRMPEMPKSLRDLAAAYLGLPNWKMLAGEDEGDLK